MSRNSQAQRTVNAYVAGLNRCLNALPTASIAAAADCLWKVASRGGTIFIAGNGGSAATAAHMALDHAKSTRGRPPRPGALRIRTLALLEPAALSAWANDEGYDRVFAEPITSLARRGDAVILLSVSGRSPNIVAAARAARRAGCLVVALVGAGPTPLRRAADLAVVVPSTDYQIVEDAHAAISHALTSCLQDRVAANEREGRVRRARGASPLRDLPTRRRP